MNILRWEGAGRQSLRGSLSCCCWELRIAVDFESKMNLVGGYNLLKDHKVLLYYYRDERALSTMSKMIWAAQCPSSEDMK